MKCENIKNKIKWLCDLCFRNDQNNSEEDLTTPLKQIQPVIKSQKEHLSSSFVPKQSLKLQIQDPPIQIKRINTSEDQESQPPNKSLKKQFSILKEQQFYSIDSKHMDSEKSLVDSTKLFSQLNKIKTKNQSSTDFRNIRSKSSIYSSSECQDTPNKSINVNDEIIKLKDWMYKQYGKPRQVNFKINYAVRLKITGRGMVNLLIHKLQDCLAHYMGESSYQGLVFNNKSKTVESLHIKNEVGASNYKRSKYMSFYTIRGYVSNVAPILKILNSRYALNILHSFSQVKVVEYQGGHLGNPLPLLEVQQDNKLLKERKTYHIATQLSQSQSKEDPQLLLVNFSLDEGDQSWIRAIRLNLGLAGQIQLYTQSSQEIQQNERHFFKKRFNNFVKLLTQFELIAG